MELDVAIPAHNEADVILETLRMISNVLGTIPNLKWRIIVAENGSTDRTYETVVEANLPHVEVFRAIGRGKGIAIKEAALRSQAEFFAFTDADCSPHPNAFGEALTLLTKNTADLVIGSRFHPNTVSDRSFLRNISSRIFNLLARVIIGITVNDTQCPMKVMNIAAKKQLLLSSEDKWLLDLEHIARVERSNLTITTLPVMWTEFRYVTRKSKLNLPLDGSHAIIDMLRMRKDLNQQHHGT